ncbi:MAG: substrate-binding domain-containing protein [Clostridia bacterium]|nr:substrate-binding domain-containing protein [Clostridia bacterium]
MITGFDGSPEASLVDPSLTTVSIQSSEIGKLSADVLNSRILQPDRPYRRVFVLSTPVFAESTERK